MRLLLRISQSSRVLGYIHKPTSFCKFVKKMAAAPYNLVDIGANLTHPSFKKDLSETIKRAHDAGVAKLMITGTSIQNSEDALRISKEYPNLYCTAGIHPHDAKTWDDKSLGILEGLLAQPKCVAVGECGLDFNRNFSPQDVQLRVFEIQVELACRLKKPLFIHERDAADEMVEILERHKQNLPPTVIHCFTGTIEQATRYFDMGLYIGLTGFLWKDRLDNGVQAGLRDHKFPLDRLLLETDSPFMYPNILKKNKIPKEITCKISDHAKEYLKHSSFNRNEPSSLAATLELIAAFMNVDPVEVAQKTTENANKIFILS